MDVHKNKQYVGGWFCGGFEPSAYKTDDFEVCYKKHSKGEFWDKHYHAIATEINYLIRGKMTIQGKLLESGDCFVIHPKEIADPVFLDDCELIVIKTPSIIGDKYIVE